MVFGIGAGLLLLAPTARASNGTKPRIPVDWSGAPCMTIVDRSTGTVLSLPYAIPQEDTEITDDEVEDSRTHQFFGMCRARSPQNFLPRWITQADIDRAIAVGAAPENIDPEDILESSTVWADCFHRINADDERRPITFAAADAGIDWDTTDVPAGTYIIDAYTWEPPLNIWSTHPGVVKLVDDPDPNASAPALAINNTEEVINKNQTVTIEGCVSAEEGSTVTAYWGMAESEVTWNAFIENDPVVGETFAVDFAPGEELGGESVMIRVDVTDPTGRTFTNYMRELVIILGTDGPVDCEDGGGFIGGAGCSDSGDSGDSGGSVTSGGSDDTGSAGSGGSGMPPSQDGGDGGGGGCGCTVSTPGAPVGAGLLLLGLLGLRRRRAA